MEFKVGDKVHPKHIIPVSNKKNMFEDQDGVVINIASHDNEHYFITVRRSSDGEIFQAIDYFWEHA